MKNTVRFFVSVSLVFTFLFSSLPSANACGPYTLSPVFSLKKNADFPLSEFANGKMGVVPATFDIMPLFVYYRQLNNLPLSKNEQKQIVTAMENQIFYRNGINDTSDANYSQETYLPNYVDAWLAARAKVSGEPRNIETEKQIADSYYYFTNCLPDAFKNATKTLEARIDKYGNNDNTKEWVKGQDAVFANCESAKSVPEILSPTFPEWLRKDREYQIAAAQFYMGDFVKSRESFDKIGADNVSVWKNTAKFVSARTFIRQASFIEIPDDEAAKIQAENQRKEFLRQAAERLQSILADNSIQEFHQSASRLLGLVKFRMTPLERQKELNETLTQSAENTNIYNDLTDLEWLLNYSFNRAYDTGLELDRLEAEKAGKDFDYNYKFKLRDLPANAAQGELSDWIFTYKAADGFAHAFDKWKETNKLHWLAAAISKTDAKSAQTAELLAEANKIAKDSPAFATIRFHQIRLLLETNKRTEAKQKLDEVVAGNNLKNLPLSSQNRFLAQRMILADNLAEFLSFAQRKAAIFSWNETDREEPTSLKTDEKLKAWETRTMFDVDAAAFLNEKVPLSVLREAALSPQLPEHLKKFVVIAVWTRAFMLGNQTIEKEFTPLMARYAKEFAPLFAKYSSANNPVNREAAALIVILRYPVIQPYVPVGYGREDSTATEIDSIRGNWWCVENKADTNGLVYPNFLNETQTIAAGREKRQMIALGESATMLTRRAVDFANKNPAHPSTPEILHLAVRSTRYGCKDDNTGRFSKQAFDILHKKYKTSPWTKNTPYWFGQ